MPHRYARQIWTDAIVPIMSTYMLLPMIYNVRLTIQGGIVTNDPKGQKDVKVIGESPYQIDSADPDYEKRWKTLTKKLTATALQADAPVTQNPDGALTGFCKKSNPHLPTRWIVTVITECDSPLIAETLTTAVLQILELYTQLLPPPEET